MEQYNNENEIIDQQNYEDIDETIFADDDGEDYEVPEDYETADGENGSAISDQAGRSYEGCFRGIAASSTLENPRWVYGSLLAGPSYPAIVTYFPDGSTTTTPVRPESIGQFTGMKDVTGRPIYAKDILEVCGDYHQDPCAIRWFPGALGGRFQLTKVDIPEIHVPFHGQQFRVIGTVVTGFAGTAVPAVPEASHEGESMF